jgi:hypothetical protein
MRSAPAALLAVLFPALLGLAGCGSDTGGDGDAEPRERRTAQGTEDFCAAVGAFGASASADDWPGVEQAAADLEQAGIPANAPEQAGEGYDVLLEMVEKYDSNSEVEENITDEQDDQVEALIEYSGQTCVASDGHTDHTHGPEETPSR